MKRNPFALTAKARAFLTEYELWNNIEKIKHSADHELENEFDIDDDMERTEIYRLTEKVAEDLNRTHKIFMEGGCIDEYNKTAKNTAVDFVLETIKSDQNLRDLFEKKCGIDPLDSYKNEKTGLDLAANIMEDRLGGVSLNITVSYEDIDTEIEGLVYYSNSDTGAEIGDGAQSWNWLAWLGVEESPYFDSSWTESYLEDKKAQALSELSSYIAEGEAADKVVNSLKEFFSGLPDHRIAKLRIVGNTNGRDVKCRKCQEPWENLHIVDSIGEDFEIEDLVMGPQQDDPYGPKSRIIGVNRCPACT